LKIRFFDGGVREKRGKERILKIMLTALHKGLKISVIIGIITIVASLFLPNWAAVREKARRVNDLANLNAIWKVISSWDLTPSNSGTPLSLDQLVKNKTITSDMLINHETGKPIEYYPASSNEGDHVVLVSRGKHGVIVVKVAGQGMWVDNGPPVNETEKQQVEDLFGVERPRMPQLESSKRSLNDGIEAKKLKEQSNKVPED
jgi:hypothetical protein